MWVVRWWRRGKGIRGAFGKRMSGICAGWCMGFAGAGCSGEGGDLCRTCLLRQYAAGAYVAGCEWFWRMAATVERKSVE